MTCPVCGHSETLRGDLARLLEIAVRRRDNGAPMSAEEVIAALLEIEAHARDEH